MKISNKQTNTEFIVSVMDSCDSYYTLISLQAWLQSLYNNKTISLNEFNELTLILNEKISNLKGSR